MALHTSPSKPTSTTTTPNQPPHQSLSSPQAQQHPPTSILASPSSRTYAHIHPLLLLCLFAWRFRALVEDPVSTLLSLLPLLALLQGIYAVVCLPAAASGCSGRGEGGPGEREERQGYKWGKDWGAQTNTWGRREGKDCRMFIPALLSLALPLLLGTPLLSLILILFGAPFTTHIPHTILCAAHMSLLAGTSLVYMHGTDGTVWREIWSLSRGTDAVWGGTVGVGLGAWFGAVPIPLDWDRPWQAYPITIITGAYVGYVLGSAVGRTPLLYGKRIRFATSEDDEEEEEEEEKRDVSTSETYGDGSAGPVVSKSEKR
ncbi:mannose-ethanolamine phosphotransferase GPI11 [Paracoccidioides brasiliensis Pb18]|uniref:Glycosylphosphatidylinositol anchor biosynthesis protein 11 n=1 Tax=Paracoccidioides brasiliensis (strain Pb18) TaxID=502780 RepID=A0A0A0HYD3_PARBD|nr:mannose-ethanolamine phosphotransferase GPI11 [Paracoccidioides brasiliensis Pb18]KGM92375.1 hypothetical protein PADG_11574 [Paracoccidioides brasiliensis Pb18]